MKQPKDKLVKARVTRQMKAAVTLAAAAETEAGGGEAESIIVRKALAEYLSERGYLGASSITALKAAEDAPKFKAKRKRA